MPSSIPPPQYRTLLPRAPTSYNHPTGPGRVAPHKVRKNAGRLSRLEDPTLPDYTKSRWYPRRISDASLQTSPAGSHRHTR